MRIEELRYNITKAHMIVFTLKDVERLTGKSMKYCSLFVSRMIKLQKIKRIERGKFCFPDANRYEIASNIVFPSYISLLAAFSLYGLTTQQILRIDVITTKRHRKIVFDNLTIRFITIDRKRFFGFERMKNTMITLAQPEKAVIDAIYLNEVPDAYIYESLTEGLRKNLIDRERILEFAGKMCSKTTVKKAKDMITEMGADK